MEALRSEADMNALRASITLAVQRSQLFLQDSDAADSLVRASKPKASAKPKAKKQAKAKAKSKN